MRNNQRIFIFLFTFFVVVAVGSIIFLTGRGSAFNKTRESLGATTAALSKSIIGDLSSLTTKKATPEPTAQEPAPEPAAEEPAAEEPVAEEPVAEEPADEENSDLRYFTFRINTQITILRLRKEPSEDAEILNKLERNAVGYVLKPGNEWCKVATQSGNIGYCSTQYLALTEISKDRFPAEFVNMVEAPDEELSAAFH